MIDLETLSTNPNAVVLTIGGVKFDPKSQMKPYDEMYFRVDVDSQTKMGRDVMQETSFTSEEITGPELSKYIQGRKS